MTKELKLFCFGFGQVAQYFIKSLVSQKYKFDFVTTTTSKTSFNKKIFGKNCDFWGSNLSLPANHPPPPAEWTTLRYASSCLVKVPIFNQNGDHLGFGCHFEFGNHDFLCRTHCMDIMPVHMILC